MATQILPINPGSDGDGRRRPRTDDYIRNDEHYLDRVGLQWLKIKAFPPVLSTAWTSSLMAMGAMRNPELLTQNMWTAMCTVTRLACSEA